MRSLVAFAAVHAAAASSLLGKRRSGASAGFLRSRQSGHGVRSGEHQQGQGLQRMDPDFFSEDAAKMEQLAPYSVAAIVPPSLERLPAGAGGKAGACDPKCTWSCGPLAECSQVCEPLCAPPECKTICGRDQDVCKTRCGPPKCAVVCPAGDCSTGGHGCAECKTVCSAPVCTTQCGEDCKNICAQPRCSWKCRTGACPKPSCQMSCTGFDACPTDFQATAPLEPPPPYPGQEMVGVTEGVAALDPAALFAPAPA